MFNVQGSKLFRLFTILLTSDLGFQTSTIHLHQYQPRLKVFVIAPKLNTSVKRIRLP